jgi:hypothetical protein
MNSTSFGEYLYAGGFIQKTAPGLLSYTPKQATRQQQVILSAKTAKENSRRF